MLLKVLFCMYIINNGSWQEPVIPLSTKYSIFAQVQRNHYLCTRKKGGNPPKNLIAYEY